MHWLAHTTSNSRSVALSGWMGMDRHAAFGVAGCSALAGTQPMRSCDTVQIFPSSSSSRYATLCCAVLYICAVLFCFSGYPQKKNTKVSPSSDGYGDDDTRHCLLFPPSTRPLPSPKLHSLCLARTSMQGVG